MKKHFINLLLLTCLTGCMPVYQNKNCTPQERAEDLLKRLTLEEKVSMMMDNSKGVERLGVKPYAWWNEALHGYARSGLATVFPQPIGMAASFSPKALNNVFVAVSDEARAKSTKYTLEGSYGRYQGLTIWTPTVNIFRDPRWGRGIETYGEDPYLSGVMGVNVVKGLQCLDEGRKYDKTHACAKHFAVHSGPEWNRHEFNAENISPRDLYETYLPPFKELVIKGQVKEVMCAYNRFEGEPCCGSNRLLTQILRNEWKFDGIVVTDCGAIDDFYDENAHKTHEDAIAASSAAVLNGTDLECGSNFKKLVDGVKKGTIKESEIDVSVRRLLKARFELGLMDDVSDVDWTNIPFSVVASARHDSLALDMARKSMTLLQNRDGILPLKMNGKTIAVVGPNANDSVMQWGNYNGTPRRTITLLQGLVDLCGDNNRIIFDQGCSWVEKNILRSTFAQCHTDRGVGFSAEYWNNKDFDGEPVATAQLTTPFQLCTSGATVFAPGVNLTDFSAIYKSVFTPEESGEVFFNFYSYGSVQLLVDGKELGSFTNKHGSKQRVYKMKVKSGQDYGLEIKFKYFASDAQLNFDLGFKKEVDIDATVNNVKDADVVIFAGGISPQLEGEEMGVKLPGFKNGDRTDIELPEVQRKLVKALYDAGKKIVFVNFSGSPIGLEPETKYCDAILQAWYPGQEGGRAIAEVLLGYYNPAGRLPVTFYKNISQLPDFEDYSMKGRTYRYMTEKPLFPFGHGLSYTEFKYGEAKINKNILSKGGTLSICIPVSNIGDIDGEEVVQVYLRRPSDVNGPNKTLRAFKRVYIGKGETSNINFELSNNDFEWFDTQNNVMRPLEGEYEILYGASSEDSCLQKINVVLK